jgi:cell division protein FtsI (penicillin-binding protein 3)
MDPQVARDLMVMLQAVLDQGGTAVAARVPGYHVAGKTGTTRVVGEHGYEQNIHNGIFVGIAPLNNPSLLVIVVIKHLNGTRLLAGPTAGPIFSHIMSNSLRLLNIPPDDLTSFHQPSPPYYRAFTPTFINKLLPNQEIKDV